MKAKCFILLFSIILIFESCSKFNNGYLGNKSNLKVFSQKEYVLWMQDPKNGFCKTKETEDIIYTCQYRSYDYIICLENKGNPVSVSARKERIEELKGMDYFEFTIRLVSETGELLKHNLSSTADYSSRVQYFAFDMQRDIQIKHGDEELQPCELFHFERTYDVAPYARFLLGFKKPEKSKCQDVLVAYNDRIFNKGSIKFTFSKDDFNKTPKLQTDK